MLYFVCPPFDETLMQMCVDRIQSVLRRRLVSRAHFAFTIPGGWTEFAAFGTTESEPVDDTDH